MSGTGAALQLPEGRGPTAPYAELRFRLVHALLANLTEVVCL